MNTNNPSVKLPFDVVSWWYLSALEAIERYDPMARYYPKNSELEKKKKLGYQMALKTVEALKDIVVTVEVTEREEKGNE